MACSHGVRWRLTITPKSFANVEPVWRASKIDAALDQLPSGLADFSFPTIINMSYRFLYQRPTLFSQPIYDFQHRLVYNVFFSFFVLLFHDFSPYQTRSTVRLTTPLALSLFFIKPYSSRLLTVTVSETGVLSSAVTFVSHHPTGTSCWTALGCLHPI